MVLFKFHVLQRTVTRFSSLLPLILVLLAWTKSSVLDAKKSSLPPGSRSVMQSVHPADGVTRESDGDIIPSSPDFDVQGLVFQMNFTHIDNTSETIGSGCIGTTRTTTTMIHPLCRPDQSINHLDIGATSTSILDVVYGVHQSKLQSCLYLSFSVTLNIYNKDVECFLPMRVFADDDIEEIWLCVGVDYRNCRHLIVYRPQDERLFIPLGPSNKRMSVDAYFTTFVLKAVADYKSKEETEGLVCALTNIIDPKVAQKCSEALATMLLRFRKRSMDSRLKMRRTRNPWPQ
jgi:hypothetical protein